MELRDNIAGWKVFEFLRWLNTGSMNTARAAHTTSVLLNGEVLVTGGLNYTSPLNSAELYDTSTGIWATTDSMNDARAEHTT
ncbi:unnamed protein product [Rotaria sp. Silwood1]|nr:unnamed protein product [Rotaria sp. Silwood1]